MDVLDDNKVDYLVSPDQESESNAQFSSNTQRENFLSGVGRPSQATQSSPEKVIDVNEPAANPTGEKAQSVQDDSEALSSDNDALEAKQVASRETRPGIKEKLASFINYRKLKVKEHFGGLHKEEFEELLDFDFQNYLQNNQPIGEVFSPAEELRRVRNLPTMEKRAAIAVFKDKLMRQRKAWATCRTFIERSIEFNHDVPKEELMGLIENFGEPYGFDAGQRRIAEQLIDRYYAKRRKVVDLRRRFPNDRALVEDLTGYSIPDDKLKVTVGPMTIDIETDGWNAGRICEQTDTPKSRLTSGGFAQETKGSDPIYFIVLNTDMWQIVRSPSLSVEVPRKHEHVHQKNKLFREVFAPEYTVHKSRDLYDYYGEQDSETKKVILEEFFTEKRRDALEEAKDEIIASLEDKWVVEVKHFQLPLFFKEGSNYDYLYGVRHLNKDPNDPVYNELSEKMLVQDYKRVIRRATDSFSRLVKHGYSKTEAVALLSDKPLEEWTKTIDRLLAPQAS